MNYQWAVTSETDVVPGIVYNLCMTEGADADTLSELANAVFVPVQRDAEGDVLD